MSKLLEQDGARSGGDRCSQGQGRDPDDRESHRLTTYFVVFNRHRGALADVELRRSLLRAVEIAGFVRRTLGRLAIPAHGIIPPGLLGYSVSGPGSGAGASVAAAGPDSSA